MAIKKIGKYNIIGELGRGAMGVVYKAEDPLIGRVVALKTIRFDLLDKKHDQDELTQRFIREAQSAGKLNHPHIVTIYDTGEDDGTTFIGMEYIQGRSLMQHIAARRPFSMDEICKLMTQIGGALDFAHGKGIIHRDIKPGNILIDDEGNSHIVDFGIARVSTSTLTQDGTQLGTPSYMAPEQIAGRHVDHRADIFSLGAILYEMLTYEKPFKGESLTSVIYKIMNEDPPPLRIYNTKFPQELDIIVKKALEKKPELRYQTCRQMINDLANYQGLFRTPVVEIPVKKQTPIQKTLKYESIPFQKQKQRKRRPIVLILSSMAVLVAAVAVVYFVYMNKSKLSEPPHAAITPSEKTEMNVQTQTPEEKPSDTQPGADIAALLDSGTRAFNKGNYEECTANMEEILKIDPQHSTAEYFLAEAKKRQAEQSKETQLRDNLRQAKTSFQEKNYANSIHNAQSVLNIDPGNAEAKNIIIGSQLQIGIQAFNQGQFDRSTKQMEEVLKLDPGNTSAQEYLERTKEKQAEQLKNLDIENTLKMAEEAYRNQDYQDCIRQTEKVLILDATNLRAKEFWSLASLKIGVQAFDRGDYEQCIQEMEAILKTDPQNSEAKRYLEESKRMQNVREVDALLSRAQTAYQEENFEETMEQSRRALELAPDNERAKEFVRLASIQLAPKEINAVVGEYIESVKNKTLSGFFKNRCSAELYQAIKTDTDLIMNLYTDLKIAVSKVSIQFKDISNANVHFTHVLTGVSKADKTPSVLSDGIVEWEIKKPNEEWIITAIRYSTEQKR